MKSICELIKVENDDIVVKERQILELSDLKKKILEKLGTNIKSIALDLGSGVRSKKEITPIIRDIFRVQFFIPVRFKGKHKILCKFIKAMFRRGRAALYKIQ